MDKDELDAWGWIGRPPQVIVDASRNIVSQWKKLERAAHRVARMRNGPRKKDAAIDIAYQRSALIQMAEKEAKNGSQEV